MTVSPTARRHTTAAQRTPISRFRQAGVSEMRTAASLRNMRDQLQATREKDEADLARAQRSRMKQARAPDVQAPEQYAALAADHEVNQHSHHLNEYGK